MSSSPRSTTLIGWLFVAVGCVSLVRHLLPVATGEVILDQDVAWAVASSLLALSGGVLLLRGVGWARWLLAFWLAAHVVLSLAHERFQLVVHAVLFVVITWLLFRVPAGRQAGGGATR